MTPRQETLPEQPALSMEGAQAATAPTSDRRLPRPPRPARSALAQTLAFLKDPLRLIDESARECGDVFALRLLGMGEWVFLTHPEHIKEMFKAPYEVLDAGEIHRMLLGNLLGLDATFTLDGQAHHQRQKLVFPQLNGRETLRYIPTIHRVTEDAVSRWPLNRPFPMVPQNHHIALEVLIQVMFAGSDRKRRGQLLELFDHYANAGPRSTLARLPFLQIDLGRFSPWGKILRLRQKTRAVFMAEIQARRAEGSDASETPADVLDVLIQARQDDGSRLSDEAILDEVINLLFAGHETTGVGLSWIVERVLAHPEVEERLRHEIADVLGDEPIASHHLRQLEYLNAVIHESHRCRPIAPMAAIRTALQPFDVGGYTVPPGAIVAESLHFMAHREELFPDPHRFAPERFLGSKPQRYEWTPFGGGKRACAGKGLAHLELVCVIATLFQRTRLRLHRAENKMVREGQMFAPERGLEIVLEERSSSGRLS